MKSTLSSKAKAIADAVVGKPGNHESVAEDKVDRLTTAMNLAGQPDAKNSNPDAVQNSGKFDEQMAEALELELSIVGLGTDYAPNREADPVKDTSKKSGKISEIQKRQTATREIATKIRESSVSLSNVAELVELLTAYLEKSEIEISSLEKKEADAVKLSEAANILASKFSDNKIVCATQKKQISLLEKQAKSSLEEIDHLKIENARLDDKTLTQAQDLSELKLSSEELLNEKQDLAEKFGLLSSEKTQVSEELVETKKKLNSAQTKTRQQTKLLAKKDTALAEMQQKNEDVQKALDDIQSKHLALQERHLERDAELQKAVSELDSLRNELSEKLRLAQQRCSKFEAKVADNATTPDDSDNLPTVNAPPSIGPVIEDSDEDSIPPSSTPKSTRMGTSSCVADTAPISIIG